MPPKFRPKPADSQDPSNVDDDDDDTFFTRNKLGWQGVKVDAITSPKEKKRESSSPDYEPNPKRRKPAKSGFDWTKPGATLVLDMGSDSDEVVEIARMDKSNSSPSKVKGKGKATVQSTRARSITPPPALRKEALDEVLQIANKTMFGDPAEQSKHDADISLLDGELDEGYDPETQAILASVIQKDVSTSHPKPFDQYASTKSAHSLEVEEMQQVLKLRVIWKGEPRPDGAAKWSFLFRLTAPFRRLHEMMQAKTGMSESDIVLVYDDQRIMLGGTPKSLRMRKDTTEEIKLYPARQWEFIEVERKRTSHITSEESVPTVAVISQGVDERDDDILVLCIRSSQYPDPIRLQARKTAKASKILQHYLKKVGENVTSYDTEGMVQPQLKQVKLSFDGDVLSGNAEIGTMDAEDEDIWDVKGL